MSPVLTEETKSRVPWFAKIPAKIVLSRLPIKYHKWRWLNVFRAGAMDDPALAFGIFRKLYEPVGLANLCNCVVLEIGPGDSLLTALFARSLGARRTWLIDAAPLASRDLSLFGKAEQLLSEAGLPVPGVGSLPSIEATMERLSATYLTEGLASLQAVADGEVDFMFSNAVLEHVRRADFSKLSIEMRRVLKPNGIASHSIDFKDHLQYGLNNLRFSDRIWESEFMASSGFYTNRITWPAMKGIFEDAGFSVELRALDLWPKGLPTNQKSMSLPFRNMREKELMVMGAHVILRPAS